MCLTYMSRMNFLASSILFDGAGHSPHSDPISTSSGEELARRLFLTGPDRSAAMINRYKWAHWLIPC